MGTGIAAAIPIVIAPYKSEWRTEVDLDYFSPKLSEYYNYNKENHNYTIKHKILLENYQSFLAEFYECIGEPCKLQNPPKLATYKAFKKYFDETARNMSVPFIYEQWRAFSIIGGICQEYWLFYSGSYKAFLEEYKTLTHFERVLVKAMKNPLAHAVKFGILG
jgi:hypothetical protein